MVCKSRDRSIMGLLLKAEKSNSELRMSSEEILAQMKVLMVTGYITTSNCLMWCLFELCKKPEVQDKLRLEVSQLPGGDPTWEQLIDGLPYLDAVLHETLRLHSPLGDTTRVVSQLDRGHCRLGMAQRARRSRRIFTMASHRLFSSSNRTWVTDESDRRCTTMRDRPLWRQRVAPGLLASNCRMTGHRLECDILN